MLKALVLRFLKGKWGAIIPYIFKAAAEGQLGAIPKKLYWLLNGYATFTGMIFVGLGTGLEAVSTAFPDQPWVPVAAQWIFKIGTVLATVGLLRGGVNSPWPEGAQIEHMKLKALPQMQSLAAPMEIPVGDMLRSVIKRGFFRKILDALKGIRIGKGDVTIVLSEKGGVPGLKQSQFDSKPHDIEPPQRGRTP
jgi:hypothetical protein